MSAYEQVEVVGVRVEMPSNAPIVLVRARAEDIVVPIWIGPSEAAAIAMALQGVTAPRPMTHDLFVATLVSAGAPLREVRITRLEDGVFFGQLVLDGALVDARPSDAIALALRAGVPIMVARVVLDQAGIPASDDTEPADPAPAEAGGAEPEQTGPEADAAVAQFREFLDRVTPEDFTGP